MMSRILFGVVLVAALSSVAVDAGEETSEGVSALVERVKPSVVVVSFSGRDGERLGLGSGFVVDPAGLIATNLHVVGEARPITVRMLDGTEHPVVAVHATDRTHDLAILKIEAADLPALELGDSDSLVQGQSVVALGNPLGLEHSVVEGVVSAVREDIDGSPMIQLAIPIERGNSGGPVVDRQGRVLGLITLKSQLTENLGYAVAVNALKPLLAKPNPIPMSGWLTIGTLNPRLWQAPDDVRWRQRAGQILVEGRGRGFGGRSLLFSKTSLPDLPCEVAVSVKLEEVDGAAGLIFYADGEDRHYGFYPSSGQLRLSRFDGPDVYSWKVLDETRSDAYRADEWNRLKVRLAPGRIECYCNDQLIFTSHDTQYTAGQVGLAKFRHTSAAFKRFEVGQEVRSSVPTAEVQQALLHLIDEVPTQHPPARKLIDDVLAQADAGAAGSVLRQEARRLEQQAARIRQLADGVHTESVIRQLSDLFREDEDAPELVRAALLVAALDNDELDAAAYEAQVDEMASDVKARLAEDADDAAKRQALHQYLFEEQGFHGSRTNYGSASNSYLNEVLDDREGLPITLSVLYLAIADRIGLPADGIGLPGHFIVRVEAGDDWQLVDVFDRGTLISREEAILRVTTNTDREWQDDYLDPQPPRAIIVRMLRNLINHAAGESDAEAALRHVNALLVVQPDSAVDRLYRAVLCYNTQRTEQGLADVDWLLEQEPEGVPLPRVLQLQSLLQENAASD